MALIFLRTIIVFATLLVVMRLMGKRQIGEMQPFELVITLIISDLACIPMADTSIPLLYGIVSILAIYFLHQIVCLLDMTIPPMKSLIGGRPSIVINKNGIDGAELKKNNLDVSDLVESMRGAGYFSLDSVDYALYEANGSFSALPKKNYEQFQTSISVLIIHEGKFQKKNIAKTKKEPEFFSTLLKNRGIKSPKQVFVMTMDGRGKCYLQKQGSPYEVFFVHLEENLW